MGKASTEIMVGLFLLAGFLCFAAFAVKFGRGEIADGRHYELVAKFDSVAGLKAGAPVEIAGVPIGKVGRISLDKDRALVHIRIKEGVSVEEDALASIRTKGVIGERYIKIKPGATGKLAPGAEITETEPAMEIEELVGKFIYSKK